MRSKSSRTPPKSSAMIPFIIAASHSLFMGVHNLEKDASKALVDTVIGMNLNAAMFCLVVAVILLISRTFVGGTAIAVLLDSGAVDLLPRAWALM
ncbi:MAG: hypothetical protein ACLR0U_31035 [Enterocloster clostridioformis]